MELENTLIGHPQVLEAAVVGVPDERWQERPLAAVVLQDGATVTPAELRDFLADKVVRWWLPERWTLVDEIPRTSVGKYDKRPSAPAAPRAPYRSRPSSVPRVDRR